MLASFSVTFKQITVLFIFIAIGYILKKTKATPDTLAKSLSALEVHIFLPMLTVGAFAKNFKVDIIMDKLPLVLSAIVVFIVVFIPAIIICRIFIKNNPLTRDIFIYSYTFTNMSYFGYPIVLALYGEDVFFDFLIFCIPLHVFVNTIGIYLLNPNRSLSLKSVFNMPMVGLIIGIILGLSNIPLPGVFFDITNMGGNCMAPIGMILTGYVFATINLKELVSSAAVNITSILKLTIVPFIATLFLWAIHFPVALSTLIVLYLCLPAGINSVIFPEAFGGDSKSGAQICFISTMACLVTIPLMLAVMNMFIK